MQTRRWWLVLCVGVLVTAALGTLGFRLFSKGVASGFEHLLPDGRESVVELQRVSKRTAGVSTLFVVLEAPEDGPVDRAKLREASDAVTAEVRKLGEPWVGSADNGVQEALHFFEKNIGLYAKTDDLKKLHQDIEAYYKDRAGKELVGDFDDDPEPTPDFLSPEGIKKRFGLDEAIGNRYPDGYFESEDGRVHVVTIRSKVLGGDLDNGTKALELVGEAVKRADLDRFQSGIKVGYAGDLYSGIAEVKEINEDVSKVGLFGFTLLLTVVFIYYLRLRTVVMMLVTIATGLIWTAGAASLLVKQLNTATGFVFTILAGNGINTGVIYMARYLEARRAGEDVEKSMSIAHGDTFMATLCASGASAASFFSLQVTAFRGFRELGLIGGVGLCLCWLATLVILPPMLAGVELVSPIVRPAKGILGRFQSTFEQSFGKPFAFVVERAARLIAIIGLAVSAIGFVLLVRYVQGDPFEWDMNNLRNDPTSRAEEERVKRLADSITGYVGADSMAILVDDVAQIGPLRTALYEKRDAAAPEVKPFDRIVALEDYLPTDQGEKIPVLTAIKTRVEKAHKLGAIGEDDWKKIEKYIPKNEIAKIGLTELPEGVARPFTEVDGTRGRIVFIVPTSPSLTEDARYLLRWAESFRKTELPGGSVVLGSGRSVIYADMWQAVMSAVPIALIASLSAVMLVVLLTFRAGRPALLVLGALVLGIGWMGLAVSVLQLKLNFLNFVALPLTFGIGVDYSVNVVWRASREGPQGALTAVRETGGAVVLCSMTTTLGYLALLGSTNFAVRSLGLASMVGEISTMLGAMLVLPGALLWLGQRDKKKLEPVHVVASPEAGASDQS